MAYHWSESTTELRGVTGGCERLQDCPFAADGEMVGPRVCMSTLRVLGALSSTTPEEAITEACETVRTGTE